jgi:CubicO group peptidase (beta-lactamase class C family)
MHSAHRRRLIVFALGVSAALSLLSGCARPSAEAVSSTASAAYSPPRGEWARRSPAAVEMDSAAVAAAVAFARAHEIGWLTDMKAQIDKNVAAEPYPAVLGPVTDRGPQGGAIIRHGYLIAEWGEPQRVDMTFSVAKSYLATVAGLAFDRGLIPDVQRPVRELVHDGGFESPHNAAITWHHLFTQTSEWEGVLWDKPDVADRRAGRTRTLEAPGTFWEYNDVRVNRTSLSLLRLFREPLPVVLKREIMDPIGASDRWVWHGYRNSTVDVDGKAIESVSGGGHWGGGVWASTHDHARFGLLMLRRGKWNGRQLLSERWIAMATTPTPIRPVYGYMWWLNTNRAQYASASPSAFFALGAGGNIIWIEPEDDLVVVTRWLDTRHANEFMGMVRAAIRQPAASGSATR